VAIMTGATPTELEQALTKDAVPPRRDAG